MSSRMATPVIQAFRYGRIQLHARGQLDVLLVPWDLALVSCTYVYGCSLSLLPHTIIYCSLSELLYKQLMLFVVRMKYRTDRHLKKLKS